MNCVSKTEGHRELTLNIQNLSKEGKTNRLTDRKLTNSEYGNSIGHWVKKSPIHFEFIHIRGEVFGECPRPFTPI